jgi:uncharacterized membrane protein YfhO
MKMLRKIWPALVMLGFIVVFFRENIFPAHGNFIGGIDVAQYFLWHAQFIKEQLLSGSVPLWNPYYYSGHPFIANPQTFVFYPATLLFAALPLPWAFNIDTLLHIYLAAAGIYCFVLLITESRSSGLASAVVYSLSGYFMNRIYAGHLTMIHTAALLPWIFYLFEKGYKTGQTRFFLITGLVFGLQILSGEPQNNYYTALFLTVYALIRYVSTPQPARPKPFYRPGIFLVLILLAAFGISAVQVLPSWEFMSLSDRAEKTYQFATAYSFPPQNFFTFLVPVTKGSVLTADCEFSGYIGVLAVILAGIGACFSRHSQHTWCFRIMALIAVTIMLGNNTPIYHLYYQCLPGISTFRIPARCLVIFTFSMSALTGLGIQHICQTATTRKQRIAAMGLCAVLLLCLFAGAAFFQVPLASKDIVLAVAFFVVAFVILDLGRFAKNKSVVAGVIIAVLFIDLYLAYHSQTPTINQNEVLKKQSYERLFGNDRGFYRVASPLDALVGANFHYYNVNAYTPVVLGRYFRFMHETANSPVDAKTRHTLNPQIFSRNSVFSSKVLGIKYALIKNEDGFELITAKQVMPRATLVSNALFLPRLEDQMQYIKRPDFDPQKQVLLEAVPPKNVPPNPKGTEAPPDGNNVVITKYQPNRIEVDCASDCDTYLVLSELFYPGWRAYIDGNKVQILRADYLLRAVPLTAGRHNVVFVYRPASFLIGAAITIFTLLLLGAISLLLYFCSLGKQKSGQLSFV